MKRGFTLLELIIVMIIIGVLATLGFTQYTRLVEKGRTTEAKSILGTVRTAQQSYLLEWGSYTATLANLAVEVVTSCAQTTHYFSYSSSSTAGTATRCSASGKPPAGVSAYTISVDYAAGTWGGSAGHY